jgi:hypothetical protein
VLENDVKEDFLCCVPIDGRATSLEVFSISSSCLQENEIMCEKYIGLCTDRAQLNARLEMLV